jgi:hypothetical protein
MDIHTYIDDGWHVNGNRFMSENDSVVSQLFYGMFQNTVTCLTCSYTSISFNVSSQLTLDIPVNKVICCCCTYLSFCFCLSAFLPFCLPASVCLHFSFHLLSFYVNFTVAVGSLRCYSHFLGYLIQHQRLNNVWMDLLRAKN